MRIAIALIFLSIHPTLNSQIRINFDDIEQYNSIYDYPSFYYVDTFSLVNKRYENNQLINCFYFDESQLRLDSLMRFFPNGNVAYKIRVSNYTKFENQFGNTYLPDYELLTFYESGDQRSEERNFYLFGTRYFSLNIYSRKENVLIYSEVFHFKNYETGTFQKFDNNNNNNVFEVYANGELIETWTLSGSPDNQVYVESVKLEKNQNNIKKNQQIRKILKRKKFFYLNRKIVIQKKL